MLNPFDAALRELRDMNEALIGRLDTIIQRLDVLIANSPPPSSDLDGDGK